MEHSYQDYTSDIDLQELKLRAFTKAIEISPQVKQITLGPNSSTNYDKISTEKNNSNGIRNGKPVHHNGTSIALDSSNNSDYSFEKLVHECENNQKETTKIVFNNMITKMVAKRAEIMAELVNRQENEYQQLAKRNRDREIRILHEWELHDQAAKLETERMEQENKAYLEKKRLAIKSALDKQIEQVNMMETFNNNYLLVLSTVAEINNLSHDDKSTLDRVLNVYNSTIQTIKTSVDLIMERCKSSMITHEDVEKSTSAVSQISRLRENIERDMRAAEEERIKKLENERKIITRETVEVSSKSPLKADIPETKSKPRYISDESLKLYEETRSFLEEYERRLRPLLDDPSLKKYRFDCQKAVNTPVNAISSVSGAHIKDKYEKLSRLLKGHPVTIGGSTVSATQHPLGMAYCTNLLAKKIVTQGDLAVSSNFEAAFPLASVTIALWSQFPDLGKLLLGHFHRECPYLVPMLIPRFEGQSEEEYYKSRGYVYDNGVVEKQDKFLKRITGIFRLMASIWITDMPRSVNAPHPQNLSHAWRWMAAFLNLKPERDISATLIFDFLTVCGEDFLKYYRVQFEKIIHFLAFNYTKMLDDIDEGGPKTRLTVFIQELFTSKKISPPSGKLKDNLW